jgi:putative membrane protein
MRKINGMSVALCAALLLSAGAAVAKGEDSQPTPAQVGRSASPDGEFLTRALRVNRLELMLGRLAVERASSPEVKAMGQTMVQKHSALGQQLSDLAQRSGVAQAPELSEAQRGTFARLSSLSGSEFDEAFKTAVDAGHVDELAMYRGEVGHTNDPELALLAQRRVATLEQQVARAGAAVDHPTPAKPKNEW